MNISREEASSSLKEIGAVQQRSETLQNYRQFAPHMILWGVIWLVANGLCDFHPEQAGRIWPLLSIVGAVTSLTLGARARARRASAAGPLAMAAARDHGWRCALSGVVLFAFFAASFAVLPPHSGLQATAFISLFFMFVYMLYGTWVGLRVFFIGLLTAVAVLYGYFFLAAHQFLWLGVCGGGALIVGGLWVRKA